MRAVEFRVSDDELSGTMDKMRIWLDGNKVSVRSFKYDREGEGRVVVVLTFASDTETNAFAKAFDGKLQ